MERTTIIFALILAIVVATTWLLLTRSMPTEPVKWDRSYDTAIPLSPYNYKDRFTVLRPSDESLPTSDYVIHAWREWLEGDLDQAVLLYQIGYMYDPNNVFALRDIGDLCYENEQFTLACNYYNQYQAYFPDQASSYIYWGRSLLKANYLQEAERVLKDGLMTDDGAASPGTLYHMLSKVYEQMGRPYLEADYRAKAYRALGADLFTVIDDI